LVELGTGGRTPRRRRSVYGNMANLAKDGPKRREEKEVGVMQIFHQSHLRAM
jgi:hypothetical protein